jgi:hypothetical protein
VWWRSTPFPAPMPRASDGLRRPLPDPDGSRKWFNASCQANDGIYLFTIVPRSAIIVHLSDRSRLGRPSTG